MTQVLLVNPRTPEAEIIARAAECLRSGGLVAFPTETVYGLGAHAMDAAAVRRVFAAKGRPASDPLIVHIAGASHLGRVAARVPPLAHALASQFWPGPLTLVLPRGADVPAEVTAGGETVAVRIPSHPVAQALLRAAGVPVAAPSANLFSRPSPTRAEHVLQDLDGRIDMILDGGAAMVGIESTVLDLTTVPPRVLRHGAVTIEMLRMVVPDVAMAAEVGVDVEGGSIAHSPGLLAKHYSPRAPLTLYVGRPDARRPQMVAAAIALTAGGQRVGVLATREDAPAFRNAGVHAVEDLGAADDLISIAARLYAALRELDTAGVDVILAAGVGEAGESAQEGGGLAAALRDRLRRAAAGHIVRV